MPTVLIVDDEQHIRLLIEQTLEELEDDGIELLTAGDGDEALAVVELHRPALVFLDVMMPKRNGFDVCRTIKQELGLDATTSCCSPRRARPMTGSRARMPAPTCT